MRLRPGDVVTIKVTGNTGVIKHDLGKGFYRVLVAIQDKRAVPYWELSQPIYYRCTYKRGSLFVWWGPTLVDRVTRKLQTIKFR